MRLIIKVMMTIMMMMHKNSLNLLNGARICTSLNHSIYINTHGLLNFSVSIQAIRLELLNTPTASLQSGKNPPPMSALT